jgi:very-short-patch-repair endonuclease
LECGGIGMSAPEATTVADIVKRKLEQARTQLIERNLRNKLVNCALTSKRSKQVRVVDEMSDEVFRTLLGNRRDMTFAAGRGVHTERDDENADPDYAIWTPPEASRVDGEAIAARHRDNVLQTQLTAEGLQKRLTALYYESIESEEEQGVNVLYLALGFLKWYEDPRSEVERYAPLLLIPVELVRKGARERFQLKARDEDLNTNISLKVWLSEQHAIDLPDIPDADDWLPTQYFEQVREAIEKAPRWAVIDHEILLGFFSFNKFLLWRDLDPANWPNLDALLGHGIIRKLLAPLEERGQPEPPVIPDEARIDEHFKAADQVAILDTDSSQTIAIQTALAGRDLVIQGPPGTGKSQTIANIIAAAVDKGKSVLFVSEKLAALQVVYNRLHDVKLGPLCFELHSRRSSKQQVLSQLREAIDAAAPPAVPKDLCQQLDKVTSALWAHSDRLHRRYEPSGYTPFEIIGTICRLRDAGVGVPDFKVKGAEQWTDAQAREVLEWSEFGAQRLALSGVPSRHPWRGCDRGVLNPLDAQRLSTLTSKLVASTDAMVVILRSVWPLVRAQDGDDLQHLEFADLPKVVKALALAGAKPDESPELLCHPRWASDVDQLQHLVDLSKQLADLERELEVVFTEAAWKEDWTSVRSELAGSGQSLLRFFRGPYRHALRAYRGAVRGPLAKRHDERLTALDKLILGQRLRAQLPEISRSFAADLGPLWQTLPASWPRLSAVAAWLRATLEVGPRLSVRNERLLKWTDASGKWSGRLETITSTVASQLAEFAAFTALGQPRLSGEIDSISTTLGEILERVHAWKGSSERFNEWPPVREFLARLFEMMDSIFHEDVYSGSVSPGALVARIHLAICEQVWNHMCQHDPELAKIDGRILDRFVSTFRRLDKSRISVAASEVARRHFDRRPTGNIGEMSLVRGEINKIRNILPVRKLLERAGNAIQALKPVFLMSPLSVAQYLAPGRIKFDLLLIDEASQVRPEDALGAVARAGQIVVVGDAKQLPPTNFFNRMVQETDEAEPEDEASDGTPAIGAMESILSLCDASLSNRVMLRWHYRSHHPALIAVSNFSFYGNQLLLPPSVSIGQSADGLGIVFHQTPSGGYDRGRSATNVEEADRVADAVCRFARETPAKSLGVGTFSVAQRDVIRDRIEARRRDEPELEEFFAINRSNAFFVKNLESIQGDERDVIFISVGYGRDRDGRLAQSFGPINNDGGERRLNVLISRAKERCEVFSSLTADDIDVTSRKAGVVALKQFLLFAQKGYLDVPQTTGKPFDSDFEESVANFLTHRGYKVHPQIGTAGFYIDLGVLAPEAGGRYLLGIECDGATYHSSRSARDRDRIRQTILESRGWRIHRIWSTDWFNRRVSEEQRLLDALEHAQQPRQIDPPRSMAAPSPTERAPTEAPTVARSAVPYTEANFRIKSTQAPHEAPAHKIEDAVRRIVDLEGPIHEEEVAKRLASVWGLDRAGSRIQEIAKRALSSLRRSGHLHAGGEFWSLSSPRDLLVRDRSEAESASLRKAEYLPPAEISVAAAAIVKENIRVSVEELIVEIARRLGFQRTGTDLRDAIRKVVHADIGKALVAQEDGSVMLMTSR